MKKLAIIVTLSVMLSLLVGIIHAAGWAKIWGPTGIAVVSYDRIEGITRIYATEKSTGDIYEYQDWKSPAVWVKIGYPGKTFVTAFGLYGLSPDSSGVWKYNGTPMSWTQIGGPAGEIYGGETGLFATNPQTGDIYQYNNQPFSWTKIGGPGKEFAVGYYDRLYGLSPDGHSVWQYDGTPMSWTQIGGPTGHIYAGNNELFATNPQTGDIYHYNGSPFSWTKVGGPGKEFVVTNTGTLYNLATDGSSVWRYNGTPMSWTQVGGAAANLYAGGSTLLATNPATYDLWRYTP